MENSQVTYGFNKDREKIEHLKWICDLCCLTICIYLYSTLHSLPVTIGNFTKGLFIWSRLPQTALLPETTLPSIYMRIA